MDVLIFMALIYIAYVLRDIEKNQRTFNDVQSLRDLKLRDEVTKIK